MADVPVLSEADVVAQLRKQAAANAHDEKLYAFYSSYLGGVITEPHLFIVSMDDHLVHRGHSVFDTAMVVHGQMYQLEQHLDRFLSSAKSARLDLEKGGLNRETIRHAIFAVARAARSETQGLRFWMGSGCGGFGISPKECSGATFYCVSSALKMNPDEHYSRGISVVTSTVPIKPGKFANAKTTNYLPNVLLVMEAEDQGAWQGVWVDGDGNVAELGTANIAFVLEKGSNTITVPRFDRTLAGISVQRVMQIAERYLGLAIEQRDIPLAEAKAASEAFAFGGPYLTLPIVQWDNDVVGDGTVGEIGRQLREAQLRDFKDAWGESGQLEPL